MRVIYVEDDKELREGITWSFKCCYSCFTIDTACDYEEAAALLAEHSYDMLISDFQYPGLDYRSATSGGMDFYRLAVQTNPDVPFFFYSASDVLAKISGLAEYALRPPAGIIAKPESLLDALAPYLRARPGAGKKRTGFPEPT